MTNEDLIGLIEELVALPKENEWVEFKHNRGSASNDRIGQYISAIANAACLANQDFGYLVFGIQDETHNILGTSFRFKHEKEGNAELELWLRSLLHPSIRFQHFSFSYHGKYIELLQIPSSKGESAHFKKIPYIRFNSSLVDLRNFPEHIRVIYNSEIDWSAQIIEKATLNDLDETAIQKAREKFKEKHAGSHLYDTIDNWDDSTFLDKAKITINSKITNTALVLLGKSEASHYLLPSVAEITWKLDTEEKAYQHFGIPLFLNINHVLTRIRNIKYKIFPDNQLLSTEVNKYEAKVILEALNNCIAHQDYSQHARIILTEETQKLIFVNTGSFFEGKAEDYTLGNKTPKKYRNRWLAQAMVSLNMIDTLGYGIHRMYNEQRKRYFPLPDYSLSTKNSVSLEIYGHIINENYSKLLIERTDLSLTEVILLDKIQKDHEITDDAVKLLKRKGLIEGRKPNFHISSMIASITDKKSEYIKAKGLDDQYYMKLINDYLMKFKQAKRTDFEDFLMDKLPDVLNEEQKKSKIKNILQSLRRTGKIVVKGKIWSLS